MLTTFIKAAGILLAGVSTFAISSAAQQTLEQYRGQLSGIPVQTPPNQSVPSADPAIAGTLAEWQRLSASNGTLSFYDYANFLMAHPGWPGETGLRQDAENSMARGNWSPGVAVSYFRRFPPLSAAASARNAQALMSVGQRDQAIVAARAAWTMGALPATDEAALLGQFASFLTPDDHDKRMDALLWAGATSSAARVLPLTSAAKRGLFAARLAMRTNAPDAATLMSQAPGGEGDPGFLADKALWYKLNGASGTARALLADRTTLVTRPVNVEKWYETLLEAARAAAAEGQYDMAYRIAARVDDAYPAGTDVSARPYGERDDYTSLMWFAGRTAMTQLGRPADAVAMFERFSKGS